MAEINAYVGNANLGIGTSGGQGIFTPVDLRNTNDAADKLMSYQFYQNRDNWVRSNMIKDQNAAQAAKDLDFKLGDMLPKDREFILGKIGELNKMFTSDPNVVQLLTDNDGKIINGDEHAKYLDLKNSIDTYIGRANYRKSQSNAVAAQVGRFTDPTKRKTGEQYFNDENNTDIDHDILLYPDVAVWNPKDIQAPDIAFDKLTELPNYLKNTTFKLTDVDQALNSFLIDLDNPSNETMINSVNSYLDTYNSIIDKVQKENPDVKDPVQFRELLKRDAGGDVIVQLYDGMSKYLDFYNDPSVQAYTQKPTVEKVDLTDKIDKRELGLLFLASKAAVNQGVKTTTTGFDLQRLNINRDYEAQMAGIAQRQKEADQDYDIKLRTLDQKDDPSVANDKLNLWMDVMNTPLKNTAQADKYGYKIPVDRQLEEVFKKKLPNPGKRKTGSAYDPTGEVTVDVTDYAISDIRLTPDPSDPTDMNKATITVWYRDPMDTQDAIDKQRGRVAKQVTQTFSAQRFWAQANNLYGEKNAEKVSRSSAKFLKDQFKLLQPDFQKMANAYAAGLGNNTQAPDQTQQKAQPLTGAVDPSTLKVGQLYEVNGRIGRWNGKNLVAQ